MKNKTPIYFGIVIGLLLLVIIALLANNFLGTNTPLRDYGRCGAYLTYGFGWMGVFMLLIWALIIVLLILGIIWLTKQVKK